ncbi:tetratricopeptide repeat protein [bacterium]|nr:tetratricopeptide repeat protein [bacterium]MBU1638139.1 tetratricopeptide repeat protein [bacterium]
MLTAIGMGINTFAATIVETETIEIGTKHTFRSEALGEDRSVVVHFPESYESSHLQYPVLYFLDGDYFFYQTVAAVQFLSECGYLQTPPVPELILVGIVNVDRNRDYTPTHAPEQKTLRFPTSGGADLFHDYLKTELIPFIDEHYRTQPYRILSGWSLGGLFTVHTLMTDPNLFSAYIAVSPSMWWNSQEPVKEARTLWQKDSNLDRPLIITQGSLEGGDINASVRKGLVALLRDYSITGWDFIEIPNEGHSFVPYKALYEALPQLFSDWILPADSVAAGSDAVKAHYATLSQKYGYEVDLPEAAYFAQVTNLLGNKSYADAEVLSREWTEAFTGSAKAHYYLGRCLESQNRLEEALSYFSKACELEDSRILPDAEWNLPYKASLEQLKTKLEQDK